MGGEACVESEGRSGGVDSGAMAVGVDVVGFGGLTLISILLGDGIKNRAPREIMAMNQTPITIP
jgi:hypothetical protein